MNAYFKKGLLVALNIPNLITFGRFLLVPVVVWFILTDRFQGAFYLFVLAGISDALDGFLAKNFGWQTELGAYLDPAADKALLMSIYITLGILGLLPLWLVIAVVSRDILIVGGLLLAWIMEQPIEIKPILISKVNTAGQIVLAALVIADRGFALGFNGMIMLLVIAVGVLTIASMGAYMMTWLSHMTRQE